MMAHHIRIRTDVELLEALRLRDTGLTYLDIANRLGGTRSQWAGIFHRIDHDLAETDAA